MRNISDAGCTEIKEHILCPITFCRKSCRVWDNVEKCGRVREATSNDTDDACALHAGYVRHE